jgi:hypothetical protein
MKRLSIALIFPILAVAQNISVKPNIPIENVEMTLAAEKIQTVKSKNGGLSDFALVINPRVEFDPPLEISGSKFGSLPVSAVYVEESVKTDAKRSFSWNKETADYICALLKLGKYLEQDGLRGISEMKRGALMLTLDGDNLVSKKAAKLDLTRNEFFPYYQRDYVWTQLPCSLP